MTAPWIPYDVLNDLPLYLDRQALVSMCLVNKIFNIAASRALYGRELALHSRIPKVSTAMQTSIPPLTHWVRCKWPISPKYASMIRTVECIGARSPLMSEVPLTLTQRVKTSGVVGRSGRRGWNYFPISLDSEHSAGSEVCLILVYCESSLYLTSFANGLLIKDQVIRGTDQDRNIARNNIILSSVERYQ